MDKKIGLWAFGLLIILILIMGWATWNEHMYGSERTYSMFYNSLWFTLLWVLLATIGCYFMLTVSLHRRLSVFLLHAALLVILAGALVTRLSGKTGSVHLRENHPIHFFMDASTGTRVDLPFLLSLKSFGIEYYPGTSSPSDYVSHVEVKDMNGDSSFEQKVSMNHILRHKGYRFYQSSFDEDMQGSVLSVNHDVWGITLSYAGYFLLFFSMLLVLFDRKEHFRFLLKKLAHKSTVIALLLWGSVVAIQAQPVVASDFLTIGKEQSQRLGSLWADYHGRICPVQTLAYDFTTKITGKSNYKSLNSEQFFFGWLLFSEKWQQIPVFEVENEEVRKLLRTPSVPARFTDFFDRNGQYVFTPYLSQIYGTSRPKGALKEIAKLDEKIQLVWMLQTGELFKVFPLTNENGQLQWYASNEQLPPQTDHIDSLFVRNFFGMYRESVISGDINNTEALLNKFIAYQHLRGGSTIPSDTYLKAERTYNQLDIFSLLFKICLTLGCAGLIFFVAASLRNKSYNRIESVFYACLWLVFIADTAGLGLRMYLGGRLPLSNGYETMLLISWIVLFTGILTRRYSFLITVFSFLLAGFTLLVAHISSMNPQITPLVPVLQSSLLSIHVLTIMIAYGLCGFMALNSITSLAIWFLGGKNVNKSAFVEKMKETSELFMYPAVFLLGAGIFIGAIWANVSWGRYWGWDPKEVWALITFLLAGLTFHDKTLTWFRKPLFYHIFVLIIFLSVLMTYFGVNYILGGRHSYAG